ncbi:hypothetical protein UA08_05761 [Talaromyces atroroseus]|uniref:Uncharacterized protein n=1 Tax=Talaromyces atroroseus TaxID=1441469 RepID=A0A225ACX2_TALAT|nr:hypothetical protein UA08_05761 [Talaromyces atroroseus]OKL58982.1 hypothetical protein UA08_05761 [Talaromyces atroroseus]
MGIPLWREPSPPAPKSSVKSDPCAHTRSSIRRRGAVRHVSRANANSVSPRSSLSVPHPENSQYGRSILQSPSLDEVALLDPVRDSVSDDSTRRELGSRLLRDALRHRQPGRRLRIPRESSLRFEMPSPPWSPNEPPQRSSMGDYARIRPTTDSFPFSPRFAPAYAFRRENSVTPAHPERPASHSSTPRPPLRTTEDGPAPSVRYLRRVGHRSVGETNGNTTSSRPEIDGLGDRQRSASPDDDLDNAWETLLTTLAPDPNLPNADADSSFTSTGAPAPTNHSRATDSTRRSHPSQTWQIPLGPSATVHMVLDPYPEYLNPCDLPDSATGSDTEADSDLELRRSGSRQRRHLRARLLDSASALGSTQDSQPPIPILSRSSTLPSISSFASQDRSSGVDMRAIVDRLAQREDIPDEWWVAAGLSRTIGRQLDVSDASPDLVNDTRTNAADEA